MFASKSENFLQEQWLQFPGFLASFGARRFPKGERKVLWCARRRIPLLGLDAPTPAREQGLQPYGAFTLFFRWRKKSVQKKASGTATLAARPTSHCGQALRYACAWLRASWPSAISGASRPSASLGGGLRSAVAPSGLSSTSVRFAHPSGEKALDCPFLKEGVRNVARNGVG